MFGGKSNILRLTPEKKPSHPVFSGFYPPTEIRGQNDKKMAWGDEGRARAGWGDGALHLVN